MTSRQGLELLLRRADLHVEGVLREASNLTLRVHLGTPGSTERAVYKPVRGERPLHDFPDGTLAHREVAAYLVSEAGGWHLVPPTVLREDGPLGPGSVQWWVPDAEQAPEDAWVTLAPEAEVPEQWLRVLHGQAPDGSAVVLAHPDAEDLQALSVLDVVLNNADRKAAHLVTEGERRLWAVDHGVTLHAEDKLRTVLWGFAGRPLPPRERDRLGRLRAALSGELAASLAEHLTDVEVDALRHRVAELLDTGVLPAPPADRYPLPWPLW